MRDRLIGLLDKVQLHGVDLPVDRERYPSDEVSVSNERIAEHLVDNGVTIRERGKWQYHSFLKAKCSQCGIKRNWMKERWYDFCPRCGSDMRGENDEKQ